MLSADVRLNLVKTDENWNLFNVELSKTFSNCVKDNRKNNRASPLGLVTLITFKDPSNRCRVKPNL